MTNSKPVCPNEVDFRVAIHGAGGSTPKTCRTFQIVLLPLRTTLTSSLSR